MKAKKWMWLLIVCWFVKSDQFLWAARDSIRFQGRLTDTQGRPVTGPQNRVKFSLYSSSDNFSSLWDSTEQKVATNEAGLFSIDIGPLPQSLFSDADLYLQVYVLSNGNFNPLLPRQKLNSVPFSSYADFSGFAETAKSVADDSVTSSKIKDGGIFADDISNRSITSVKLSLEVAGQFIPPGMIAMFRTQCPNGWSLFTEMNGRFPVGPQGMMGKSLGEFGGSVSHQHQMQHVHDIQHTHSITHRHYLEGNTEYAITQIQGIEYSDQGSPRWVDKKLHNHHFAGFSGDALGLNDEVKPNSGPPSLTQTGAMDTILTKEADHSPPFYVVLFCVKD